MLYGKIKLPKQQSQNRMFRPKQNFFTAALEACFPLKTAKVAVIPQPLEAALRESKERRNGTNCQDRKGK